MIWTRAISILILGMALASCASPKTVSTTVRVPTGAEKKGTPEGAIEITFKRALSYLKRGDAKRARVLLEKIASTNGNHSAIFNALGVAYKKQGKLDKAVDAYKKALELQETSVEAHYNLGIVYRENGQMKEAESEYARAIVIDPNFAPAHYNLGILYDLYMDRPSKALKHFKKYRDLAGDKESLNLWIKDLERRSQVSMLTGVSQRRGG